MIFEDENVITRENYPESVYSADAEGEPDDEQERTVSEMLVRGSTMLLWTTPNDVPNCRYSPGLLYGARKSNDRLVTLPVHNYHAISPFDTTY